MNIEDRIDGYDPELDAIETKCSFCEKPFVWVDSVGGFEPNCTCEDPELLPNGEERFR